MTACVNKNYKRRAAGVVTASLVGALTLGGVSLAVATPALAAEMELQNTVTTAVDFNAGSVAGATDALGKSLDLKGALEFTKGSNRSGVTITSVKPKEGAAVDTTDATKWKTTFFTADKSLSDYTADADVYVNGTKKNLTWVGNSMPTKVGTYYAVVEALSGNTDFFDGSENSTKVRVGVEFKVVSPSLDGVSLYDATDDDQTFVYNAGAQSFQLKMNGANVAVNGQGAELDLAVYAEGGNTDLLANKSTLAAGKYVARVTGKASGPYAGQSKDIKFEVAKLDLSDAVIVSKDVEKTSDNLGTVLDHAKLAGILDSINGMSYDTFHGTNGDQTLAAKFVSSKDDISAGKGSYVYEVYATEVAGKENPNITGTAKVSFDMVGDVLAASNFTYNGNQMDKSTKAQPLTVDLSLKNSLFDASKVKVTSGSNALPSDVVSLTVTKADGSEATLDELDTTAGLYCVTAKVKSDKLEDPYSLGGTSSMWVRVIKGTVKDGADITVTYGGKVSDAFDVTYDGTDMLKGVSVKVVDSKGNVVDPSDYKVAVTDSKGRAVTEMVNSDTYTITVSSSSYDITGTGTCTFKVSPINVTELRVADQLKFGDESVLAYTGSDIVPGFEYLTNPTEKDASKLVWAKVPTSAYDIVSYTLGSKKVASMKDAGDYTVKVAVADGEANYVFTDTDATVTVSKKSVFTDVPAGKWYSESVYQAKSQGYINGYSGTTMFGPETSIKRGDVAVVLMNMATANTANGKEEVSSDRINEYVGYATKYTDVDENTYYAAAIGWATKLGIVSGHDGKFRPEETVTREEFAAMLANYAAAKGEDVISANGDALAKFTDSSSVSGWAREAMEWATSEGILNGHDGVCDPSGDVSRAMVAAMCVNYQPTSPSKSTLFE